MDKSIIFYLQSCFLAAFSKCFLADQTKARVVRQKRIMKKKKLIPGLAFWRNCFRYYIMDNITLDWLRRRLVSEWISIWRSLIEIWIPTSNVSGCTDFFFMSISNRLKWYLTHNWGVICSCIPPTLPWAFVILWILLFSPSRSTRGAVLVSLGDQSDDNWKTGLLYPPHEVRLFGLSFFRF